MATYLDKDGLLYFWQKIKTYITNAVPTKTSDLTNDSSFATSSDIPSASSTTPKMDGTAAIGTTATGWARGDHVHPTDTSRAAETEVENLAKALSDSKNTTTTTDDVVINGTTYAIPTYEYISATSNSLYNHKTDSTIHVTSDEKATWNAKQDALTIDTATSTTSTNPITNKAITTAVNAKAALASPTFTGTPKAPTAASGTNTTQIATTAFVQSAVASAVGGLTSISYSVVTALPETGETGVIYLIADTHSDSNDSYDEYIWLGSAFEKIGNTDVDLSGYQTTMTAIANSEIDTVVAS